MGTQGARLTAVRPFALEHRATLESIPHSSRALELETPAQPEVCHVRLSLSRNRKGAFKSKF